MYSDVGIIIPNIYPTTYNRGLTSSLRALGGVDFSKQQLLLSILLDGPLTSRGDP